MFVSCDIDIFQWLHSSIYKYRFVNSAETITAVKYTIVCNSKFDIIVCDG